MKKKIIFKWLHPDCLKEGCTHCSPLCTTLMWLIAIAIGQDISLNVSTVQIFMLLFFSGTHKGNSLFILRIRTTKCSFPNAKTSLSCQSRFSRPNTFKSLYLPQENCWFFSWTSLCSYVQNRKSNWDLASWQKEF